MYRYALELYWPGGEHHTMPLTVDAWNEEDLSQRLTSIIVDGVCWRIAKAEQRIVHPRDN